MNIKPIKIDYANPPKGGARGRFWHIPGKFWVEGYIRPEFGTDYVKTKEGLYALLRDFSHYIPELPPPDDPAWEAE